MNFTFGVDYYPEHWSKERLSTDVALMKEMGIEVVRMAEFSWFLMEPEEGHYCFDWLDEAVNALHEAGIQVILGTPTAAPPAWLIEKHPEIQPINSDGLVHGFGGRHHDCQSNPTYRAYIQRFVTAFARHYQDHPAVVGWQIDNELGNSHGDLCHCKSCQAAFQTWLSRKYKNIQDLNEKWGTVFWSQGYQTFTQIPTPRRTAAGHNPSHMLDWKLFCSDLVLEFHQFQADIIRQVSDRWFITHNMMGFSDKLSYYELGKQLDFVAHDQYPGGYWLSGQRSVTSRVTDLSSELSFIRSLKAAPFMIMEQQSSVTGWETLGRAPAPGQLALWSLQSLAHGANAIVYFRWRSCGVGTEQYWHGLLPHSGIPGRNFRELAEFFRQMKPLMPLWQKAMPPREAAIAFSYAEEYAIGIQPHHPQISYTGHLKTYYQALHQMNIPTDFVPFDGDFQAYKLLVVPFYFMTSPEMNQKLRDYAANGGTLVLDMRCGVKDMFNRCLLDEPLPAGLQDLTGMVVDEYDCLMDADNTVVWDGVSYPCQKWCDVISCGSADALATFGKHFYQGKPAITHNRWGKGHVYYVGTEMSGALALRLMEELQQTSGVCSLGESVDGVEIVCRQDADHSYIFALNHTGETQPLAIRANWQCLLGSGKPEIAPYGFQIFEVMP